MFTCALVLLPGTGLPCYLGGSLQKISWGLGCADCDVLRGVRRSSFLVAFRARPASTAHVGVSSRRVAPPILGRLHRISYVGLRSVTTLIYRMPEPHARDM